jgi:hypothetical protein
VCFLPSREDEVRQALSREAAQTEEVIAWLKQGLFSGGRDEEGIHGKNLLKP